MPGSWFRAPTNGIPTSAPAMRLMPRPHVEALVTQMTADDSRHGVTIASAKQLTGAPRLGQGMRGADGVCQSVEVAVHVVVFALHVLVT
jgi:hypothetical protein